MEPVFLSSTEMDFPRLVEDSLNLLTTCADQAESLRGCISANLSVLGSIPKTGDDPESLNTCVASFVSITQISDRLIREARNTKAKLNNALTIARSHKGQDAEIMCENFEGLMGAAATQIDVLHLIREDGNAAIRSMKEWGIGIEPPFTSPETASPVFQGVIGSMSATIPYSSSNNGVVPPGNDPKRTEHISGRSTQPAPPGDKPITVRDISEESPRADQPRTAVEVFNQDEPRSSSHSHCHRRKSRRHHRTRHQEDGLEAFSVAVENTSMKTNNSSATRQFGGQLSVHNSSHCETEPAIPAKQGEELRRLITDGEKQISEAFSNHSTHVAARLDELTERLKAAENLIEASALPKVTQLQQTVQGKEREIQRLVLDNRVLNDKATKLDQELTKVRRSMSSLQDINDSLHSDNEELNLQLEELLRKNVALENDLAEASKELARLRTSAVPPGAQQEPNLRGREERNPHDTTHKTVSREKVSPIKESDPTDLSEYSYSYSYGSSYGYSTNSSVSADGTLKSPSTKLESSPIGPTVRNIGPPTPEVVVGTARHSATIGNNPGLRATSQDLPQEVQMARSSTGFTDYVARQRERIRAMHKILG